jgi:hypothetical protein
MVEKTQVEEVNNIKLMNLPLILMSLMLLAVSTPITNAQLIPNPPDLTNTPLKEGDWVIYKIDVGFSGYNLTDLVRTFTNQTLGNETILQLQMIESRIQEVIRVIEAINFNLTVTQRTNETITGRLHYYYNATINDDRQTTLTLLPEWSYLGYQSAFPFLRPPNDSANTILNYITPLVNTWVTTIEQRYPGLNVSDWFSINVAELSAFYAGTYRTVNEIKVTIPNIVQHMKEIFDYFNATEAWNRIPAPIRTMNFDIEIYTHWDKEYGIFLGKKWSVRMSGLSWFAYRAVNVYASATNLWSPNMIDSFANGLTLMITGYGENLVTSFVEGFIFGDPNAQMTFYYYIIGTVVAIIVIIYIVKKIV